MLMQEPTPEMVRAWKKTYDTYRAELKPNNKPMKEVIAYLKKQYPVTELQDEKMRSVVTGNVTANEFYAHRIPDGKHPEPQVFQVENTGPGRYLYESQDEIFRGCRIIAGFEPASGYFMVEGSSRLWDELFVFRGLDEEDLDNFYLVAEYVTCIQKSGISGL